MHLGGARRLGSANEAVAGTPETGRLVMRRLLRCDSSGADPTGADSSDPTCTTDWEDDDPELPRVGAEPDSSPRQPNPSPTEGIRTAT